MSAVTRIEPSEVQATPHQDNGSIISMIARAASDPSVSIDKMERLFEMHQKMEAIKAQSAFQADMALAQAVMQPIVKDRTNAHTKSKYATLEAVDDAIRPIYTSHGFSLSFDQSPSDTGLIITCDVLHRDGHRERKMLAGTLDTAGTSGTRNKTDIQGLGSSVSYLRRYLTCMIFNVAIRNEDTDGNATAKTISAAQYVELRDKLEAVNGDEAKFSELYRVPSLTDIPAAKFEDAVARIERRAAQIAAERSTP